MTRLRLNLRASQWLAALMMIMPAAAAAEPEGPLQPLLLNSVVNGQKSEEPQLFLQDGEGRTYVSEAFLKRWNVRSLQEKPTLFDGERFYPIEMTGPMKAKVSQPEQTITLDIPAMLFERQLRSFEQVETTEMTPAGRGAFANYDFYAERSGSGTSLNGALEVGLFSSLGVASSGFVGRLGSGGRKLTRLETNWIIDRPQSLSSIRVGDGISSGGPGAPPVRFAGIQYGRNFGTRPGYVTMPLASLEGSAAVPSVIDVYVNNTLQGSREVGSGPFDLTGIPLQSGGGAIQFVVRDILGREVVSTQNFYASGRLLRKGLHDFSYEAGFLRSDFGVRSNAYGAFMASMAHRYGLTNGLTGEAFIQASKSVQLASLGLSATVQKLGLLSASGNLSSGPRGKGHSLAVSFEHSNVNFSLGGRAEMSSRSYQHLGMGPNERAPALTTQAFADVRFAGGTLGLSYIGRKNRGREDDSLAGAFTSLNLGRLGSLQLFARHSVGGRKQASFGAFLAVPFGPGRSASLSLSSEGRSQSSTVTMQKDAPAGPGFGYRTSFSAGATRSIEGQYAFNSDIATLGLQASRVGGRSGIRLSATGAVGLIGSRPFASRRLGTSFGAVGVEGFEGVRVYADNQLIGRTNSKGWLLIPSLRAFEANKIRIEETDLPLDTVLGKTVLEVRPFARSGTTIRFSARRERGVLLRIKLEDGSPLPLGATVVDQEGSEHIVASGGEVYVEGIAGRSRMTARWLDRSCTFELQVPDNDDPQPRIDGLTCTSTAFYAVR